MTLRFQSIAYDDTGSGPAVVFLHGSSYDRRIWRDFVSALRRECRCIAIDAPGHGDSADLATPPDYDPEPVAARFHALLRHAGVNDPLLVGHSLGGALATFYAAAYPTRGVINIDQSMRLGELAVALRPAKETLAGPRFKMFFETFRNTFGLEKLPPGARRLEAELSHPRREVALGYWDVLLRSDPADLDKWVDRTLDRVRAPYVAYHGADPGTNYNQWLKARCSTARLIYHPGAGHFPHFVYPDEFLQLIREMSRPSDRARNGPQI